MNKYIIKCDYSIKEIMYSKVDNTVIVKVPFLCNDDLNYGIQHVVSKLRCNSIFPSEIGFDILSLATIVYMADTRISREIHGQDSWTREIELEIPVWNLTKWTENALLINKMLRFLTGDIWNVTFVKREWVFCDNKNKRVLNNQYDKISLFSGGMDSLISTINLLTEGNNMLLIGHAGEGLTKKAQTNILAMLKEAYPDLEQELIDLWLSFRDNYIPEGGNDSNTRSRSFLFIALGIFVITGTANIKQLLVPENGFIALNVPLEVTRVGSFSTRTTHPFYLELWNKLLSGLGLDINVYNPYWNKTKGEMAAECYNKDVLFDTMKVSFSCSSPGKARWKGKSPQHCGYCVPCLIRRAAMYKAFGNDGTLYTELSIKKMLRNNDLGIGIQLRSFMYAISKVKANPNVAKLYIHKPGPLKHDDKYLNELAEIYKRGLLEIDSFVSAMEEKEEND